MIEILKIRLLQYKWHLVGLFWVFGAMAVGYGLPQQLGSGFAHVGVVPSPRPQTQPQNKIEPTPQLPEPTDKLGEGVRIWEAAPIIAASGLANSKPLTPELWKISGVFESAEGRRLIVEYPNLRTSEYLKVGDALPNGARIVAVDQKKVTVKTKVAGQLKTIVLDF